MMYIPTTRTTKERPVSLNMERRSKSVSDMILLSSEFSTRLMNERHSTSSSSSSSSTSALSTLLYGRQRRDGRGGGGGGGLSMDPLFYYEIKKTLGKGSMGYVALVKKRRQAVGGSARKRIRDTLLKHKRNQKCFHLLPFRLGGLFQFCIKDNSLLRIDDYDVDNGDDDDNISLPSKKVTNRNNYGNGDNAYTIVHSNGVPRRESVSSLPNNDHRREYMYAMKSIHLSLINDDSCIQELTNEIAILKKLDHPNIVKPIETFRWKNQIFIIMEVCSGYDLYSRDPYTEMEAVRIIAAVLSAVSYLHSNNVAHRDLKYENILFVNQSPTSTIKLIDFGLSKIHGGSETLTGGVGTIFTMAPEVLQGSYTKQADIWSVGVITYMLLSSQMPFYGRTREHVIDQIVEGTYHFGGQQWMAISEPAKEFVRNLLVVNPDERLDAERASLCDWLLPQRYSSETTTTVCDDKDDPHDKDKIRQAYQSMIQYAGYTKLKKMAMMVVAHQSTCEEIGTLQKVFQQYSAMGNSSTTTNNGCISYKEFCQAWMESELPHEEDTQFVFDACVSYVDVGICCVLFCFSSCCCYCSSLIIIFIRTQYILYIYIYIYCTILYSFQFPFFK